MIAGLTVGAWVSGRAAGRVRRGVLVSAAMSFALVGALVNVVLALVPATDTTLPWAVVGPALIAAGSGAAYPSQQLLLLDMFPALRGSAVSMFTFFTLVLNAVVAAVLAPVVTGSVLTMAMASAALVALGLVLWTTHVALGLRARAVVDVPDSLAPTDSL